MPLERGDDRDRKYAVSFLLETDDSWYRAVAALALMDLAMTTLLEACADSSFAELRKRADRILGDERFHARYVDGRLRELGASPAEAAALEDELAALLPETLCWFGPPGEQGLELLVAAEIVSRRNEELRETLSGRCCARRPRERACACPRQGSCRGSEWSSLERRLNERAGAGDGVACPWCGSVEVERLGEFGPGLMTEQWICLALQEPVRVDSKAMWAADGPLRLRGQGAAASRTMRSSRRRRR